LGERSALSTGGNGVLLVNHGIKLVPKGYSADGFCGDIGTSASNRLVR